MVHHFTLHFVAVETDKYTIYTIWPKVYGHFVYCLSAFLNLMRKNSTGLHRALTSTPSNTFRMNWSTRCEPGLITHHQCGTSLMLLWLNGTKSLQPASKIWWKAWNQKIEGCYSSRLMLMVLERQVQQLYIGEMCLHTFDHVLNVSGDKNGSSTGQQKS